jgi:hypothetical protein
MQCDSASINSLKTTFEDRKKAENTAQQVVNEI